MTTTAWRDCERLCNALDEQTVTISEAMRQRGAAADTIRELRAERDALAADNARMKKRESLYTDPTCVLFQLPNAEGCEHACVRYLRERDALAALLRDSRRYLEEHIDAMIAIAPESNALRISKTREKIAAIDAALKDKP